MNAILNEEPTPLAQLMPNAPPGLERVLQRGLEKNPEQRFQSASDLGFALEATAGPAQSVYTSNYKIQDKRAPLPRGFLAMIGAAMLVMLAVVAYTWLRPLPEPQVVNYVQLTHDGLQKSLIGSDGSRLFLTVVDSGAEDTAAVPVAGGEANTNRDAGAWHVSGGSIAGWFVVAGCGRKRLSSDRTVVERAGAGRFAQAAGGYRRTCRHLVGRWKTSGVWERR